VELSGADHRLKRARDKVAEAEVQVAIELLLWPFQSFDICAVAMAISNTSATLSRPFGGL
jgi:hypothetical protein